MEDDRALDALPRVAREAIAARLRGRPYRPPRPPGGALGRPAPVFVTLRIDGELRGCMGALEARHPDLVAETADRALVAAFEDPRFPPLGPDELERCRIEVTVLGPPEEVAGPAGLDPAVYGVEVHDGEGRRAVLLPGLAGVDTPEEQLELTRRKAGIADGVPVTVRRFAARRVREA